MEQNSRGGQGGAENTWKEGRKREVRENEESVKQISSCEGERAEASLPLKIRERKPN